MRPLGFVFIALVLTHHVFCLQPTDIPELMNIVDKVPLVHVLGAKIFMLHPELTSFLTQQTMPKFSHSTLISALTPNETPRDTVELLQNPGICDITTLNDEHATLSCPMTSATEVANNGRCTKTCSPGFTLEHQGNAKSIVIKCTETGFSSNIRCTGTPISNACRDLPTSPFGDWECTNGNDIGSSCTLTCHDGYALFMGSANQIVKSYTRECGVQPHSGINWSNPGFACTSLPVIPDTRGTRQPNAIWPQCKAPFTGLACDGLDPHYKRSYYVGLFVLFILATLSMTPVARRSFISKYYYNSQVTPDLKYDSVPVPVHVPDRVQV